MSAHLDAVSKARTAFVVAKATLEQRLREQMKEELGNLQTQVDIAVRYAFDSGETKAAIMRAMGTKDYGTMQASLDRTQRVKEVVGENPLDRVYSLHDFDNILEVTYVNHGESKYTGTARFAIHFIDGGRILLLAETPVWNSDYTVRNDVVVALDGVQDGLYYTEAVEWIREKLGE